MCDWFCCNGGVFELDTGGVAEFLRDSSLYVSTAVNLGAVFCIEMSRGQLLVGGEPARLCLGY